MDIKLRRLDNDEEQARIEGGCADHRKPNDRTLARVLGEMLTGSISASANAVGI